MLMGGIVAALAHSPCSPIRPMASSPCPPTGTWCSAVLPSAWCSWPQIRCPPRRRQIGQWLYGGLTGVLAIAIRVVNPAFPEGVMLAILLGNVCAPLFDYFVIQANIKQKEGFAMAEESAARPFYSVLILALVCSALVAGAAVGLRPLQEANRQLDQKKNILRAAGLYRPEGDVEEQFAPFKPDR